MIRLRGIFFEINPVQKRAEIEQYLELRGEPIQMHKGMFSEYSDEQPLTPTMPELESQIQFILESFEKTFSF